VDHSADAPLAGAIAAVLAWIARCGIAGQVGPPVEAKPDAAADRLRLWPLTLLPDQALRGGTLRDPLRLRLRCLLTADGFGADGSTALDSLLAAAAPDPWVALVLEPVPVEVWTAFGIHPRAALLVDTPVRVVRPDPVRPLVRAPLRVDDAPLVALRGRVLGPGDIPVSDIRIEAVDLGLSTRSDRLGEFVVAGVPATGPTRLVVSGRGLHLDTRVEPSLQPVDLHCAFKEV
jgi:hypothetical protein